MKILHQGPICSFGTQWLAPIINQYLQFEPWDSTKTYAPGTLFYLNMSEFNTLNGPTLHQQLVNRGFRVVLDNLWEVDIKKVKDAHLISCERWFWYNESLQYSDPVLQYDQYQPRRNQKYLALMPMNLARPHRVDFVEKLGNLKDQMIWSLVQQGRQLPNDGDMSDWATQRYFNPEWYNQTYVSMVVETFVRPGSKYTPVFVTEKTMKPLAFQHPLIVYGNRGTLRTIKNWGFQTFDNLWDESYDEEVDADQRCDSIIKLLAALTIKDYDAETLRRIKHNKDHFFDRGLVLRLFVKEIINPILNYAETR